MIMGVMVLVVTVPSTVVGEVRIDQHGPVAVNTSVSPCKIRPSLRAGCGAL